MCGCVRYRFTRFLLYLGYPASGAAELNVQSFCRTVSAFAMEYRTAREKLIQQRQKAISQQARKASRGFTAVDVSLFFNPSQGRIQAGPNRRQWLKRFCEAGGGGSPDEARLEQTPYPFQPH